MTFSKNASFSDLRKQTKTQKAPSSHIRVRVEGSRQVVCPELAPKNSRLQRTRGHWLLLAPCPDSNRCGPRWRGSECRKVAMPTPNLQGVCGSIGGCKPTTGYSCNRLV